MLQYNLRALFAATIIVAVVTWVLFVLPGEIGGIVMLITFMVAGSALVAGTVYFRGYSQAFCIGCLSSYALVLVALFSGPWRFGSLNGDIEFKIALSLCMVIVLVSGAVAMGMRYLALRSAPAAASGPVKQLSGLQMPQTREHAAELPPDA